MSHSLSPALHHAAYAALGLAGWSYRAIDCDEARLPALMNACGPQWAGLSLTMPLKRAVLPLLTDAEPLVTEVGAANTVVLDGTRRSGYNTDVAGMVAALGSAGIRGSYPPAALDTDGGPALPGSAVDRGRAMTGAAVDRGPAMTGTGKDMGPVLLLGAGATACAALAALRAIGIGAATVAVRELGRAGPLLAAAERLGLQVRCCPAGEADPDGAGLVISTVPAGADFLAKMILTAARPPAVVFDVVYHPWPTPLAEAAAQAGSAVIGGYELLLQQAAGQVELMTGLAAPVAAMRAAGLAELGRRGRL